MKRTFGYVILIILKMASMLILMDEVQAQSNLQKPEVGSLIPMPLKIEYTQGSFSFSANTRIFYSGDLTPIAELTAEKLGLKAIEKKKSKAKNAIFLALDSSLPNDGYNLEIRKSGINIAGGSASGIFYAIQTLRQLIGPSSKPTSIRCAKIHDQPMFSWRGLMLDCSRTFQSINYLKKTIDRLSFYKMNVLHLHLTDDQGWRMEIKSHPILTEKGAFFSPKYDEPASNQGFYTQTELRELVKYAAIRGVTIVPEIEMPGHSLEVLVCRPDLSCTGSVPDDIFPFFKGPGVTPDILCAGNENTFKLFEDILKEVFDIFPSQFIHIGGDEAPKDRWKACPKCQARIRAEGLKDEHELQSYFIRRVEKYINANGRRLIGWSEILEGGLAPNAAVMDWIGGAAEATKSGHDAVMTPTSHCYFDYSYTDINSKKAYEFNPTEGLTSEQAKHILGIQANFWSHIDRKPELVDKQLFPRLLSISERAWSPANISDWSAFEARLKKQLHWLSKLEVNYNPNY